ncbi:glutamate--tRNA ligase [Hymenobacter busanensis]|uniref:Glutamate--tRNA ligase n=1 Tax=Hymenobacter busanensis TaxID=2607656 RepID=A0A7L4ZY23_9BACT|nr:glutamate--tRNA ligase [Hymenobacter busanensis]KAA9332922.1 glutamate--tRNA ligase [Hymenobacter busanensis]QHJ08404.1 glutamate--tRNA ligase [Hymenobacter busanensis]
MEREVRVRFAPSPTGPLHIGGVRTALYNYLLARKLGGKMLLRIEDTDQNRFVPGAEQYIMDSLRWCGIEIDEGIEQGGPHAPYRQSERKPMYRQYADQLIRDGYAYYAFDTPEELDAMRARLTAAKVPNPQYNSITRTQMRNSLTLPETEVQQLLDAGAPYVIRLKVPRKEEVRFNDLIRGWVVVHSSSIDDKVLMKSDGMPTYHLANIVDDHLMEITHVIRGEEWLPSAPLHVLLYRYLGWESTMPQFAHLPLLLKPDGTGKLSKRDGDKLGFPVFPLEFHGTDAETGQPTVSSGYRESGYLPEAFINFLAFLGWNPGTQQEIFSMDELIEAFSIERVSKSPARFDQNKVRWYNEQYLRAKPDAELAQYLLEALSKQGIGNVPADKAEQIAGLVKERATFPADLAKEAQLFFQRPTGYDEQVISKKWNAQVAGALAAFAQELPAAADTTPDGIKALLTQVVEGQGMKLGQVLQALRVAVTGAAAGPDLMAIMSILGPQETAQRIQAAVEQLAGSAA